MYKFVSLLISDVMFLFSGSTSCLFIIALVGRWCFLIWFFFLLFLFDFIFLFVCCCVVLCWLDDLVIAVGAAMRFCIWCRIFFYFILSSVIVSCKLILWWHLMCHVVHYHYQHVLWLSWLYGWFVGSIRCKSVSHFSAIHSRTL